MQLVKLKKFGTLGEWIAKIETLVFELKNVVNFKEIKYNFSKDNIRVSVLSSNFDAKIYQISINYFKC